MKGFAHNLILKVRVFRTLIYKWPIPEMSSSNLHSSVLGPGCHSNCLSFFLKLDK